MITHKGNPGKNWKLHGREFSMWLIITIVCVAILQIYKTTDPLVIGIIGFTGGIIIRSYSEFLLSDKTGKYDKKHWNDIF